MSESLLVLRSGERLCAVPVEHVEETMRPLPIEALPDVPRFVRGVSVIRGEPTPIVDLRALLGDEEQRPRRLVTVRGGSGRAGLLVDEVLGLRERRDLSAQALPPLLHDAATEAVQELARLDGQLLTVLRTGRLVPDDVMRRLGAGADP